MGEKERSGPWYSGKRDLYFRAGDVHVRISRHEGGIHVKVHALKTTPITLVEVDGKPAKKKTP